MPWVSVFTTWYLLASIAGRSSSTPLDLDAVLAEAVADLLEQVRGVQQRLGWDAADIEAGAAQSAALLDAGDLQAELGRLDRRDVAARATADHHQIVSLLAHLGSPVAPRGWRTLAAPP